jgi:hypothetical protein
VVDSKENGGLPVSACTLRKYDVKARQHYHVDHAGLTKRELFAAMAMQGVLGASNGWPDLSGFPEIARRSVAQADHILAELAKDQP